MWNGFITVTADRERARWRRSCSRRTRPWPRSRPARGRPACGWPASPRERRRGSARDHVQQPRGPATCDNRREIGDHGDEPITRRCTNTCAHWCSSTPSTSTPSNLAGPAASSSVWVACTATWLTVSQQRPSSRAIAVTVALSTARRRSTYCAQRPITGCGGRSTWLWQSLVDHGVRRAGGVRLGSGVATAQERESHRREHDHGQEAGRDEGDVVVRLDHTEPEPTAPATTGCSTRWLAPVRRRRPARATLSQRRVQHRGYGAGEQQKDRHPRQRGGVVDEAADVEGRSLGEGRGVIAPRRARPAPGGWVLAGWVGGGPGPSAGGGTGPGRADRPPPSVGSSGGGGVGDREDEPASRATSTRSIACAAPEAVDDVSGLIRSLGVGSDRSGSCAMAHGPAEGFVGVLAASEAEGRVTITGNACVPAPGPWGRAPDWSATIWGR